MAKALRIVADENMPNVEAWFAEVAESIVRKPGRALTPTDLADANVLLVRSVTQVNEALLANSNIEFVGSATIGTDHVDQDFLRSKQIPFHYAPGCNAQSVTDWLLAVLARLHLNHDLNWWDKTIGVVGVGNVGAKVVERLQALGCRVLVCDPPKHAAGLLPEHQPLEQVLAQADILCFHTPHTKTGDWPTDQMIGEAELANLRAGSWLINAGRGPVFQHQPLLAPAKAQAINLVLDVWPHEPVVDEELLAQCKLASPHVAGYSLEGKQKGTQMLFEAVKVWANIEANPQVALPPAPKLNAALYEQDDVKLWASELVLQVYDPARDTVTMATSVEQGAISPQQFDALRKQYPVRRELRSTLVNNAPAELAQWLKVLGFSV